MNVCVRTSKYLNNLIEQDHLRLPHMAIEGQSVSKGYGFAIALHFDV
jgi:transposase-like protein